MQKRIFDTESGGDYNALYGYANRPGKAFAGTSITDMTVDQALAFADPSGPYAQSVKSQVGRVATPMGAYQVVGSTLADAKRGLRLTGSEKMTPGLQDMIGKWVLNTQGPGAWEGLKNISKGASDMAATVQPPYMMGGDSTHNANRREEPRAGLLGLFDRATTRDERTGLNPMQNFAAALDPLIMPELRGGDAIRKQGAQRAGALSKNRTVGMLRQQGQNKIADMLEQGLISGSDAGKYLLAVPKDDSTAVKKNYDYDVASGAFTGSLLDYQLAMKKAGATNLTVGGEGTEAFEKEFGQLDARKLAAIDNVGSSASRSLTQINRLETLLGNVPTGMSANIKQLAGNFGIQTEGLGDIQAATAIINALVPAQRPAGSGPMSDADLDLFKQSLPRIINSPGGNQMIIDTMRGLAQYDAMGSEIVQRFRAKEISKVDAFKLLNSRPDPFASFKASVVPVETDMSGEDARKLLEENRG